MSTSSPVVRGWTRPAILIAAVVIAAVALTAWKSADLKATAAAAASRPEPTEMVASAKAVARAHRRVTTAVGTVLALRSITLRNELAGTVRRVGLVPGQIVDSGTVLVALDVAIEEADLHAQEAEAELARTALGRSERLGRNQAVSQEEQDRAHAEYAVALARVERTRAIIGRKTIRAPFRARVGIADVHPGQYLNEGTQLTTLQGVGGGAHVDFAVAQDVAAGLRPGSRIEIVADDAHTLSATIAAVDARVDPTTRNATVRARIYGDHLPSPGASVRVEVPVGPSERAVAIPVSALRKGPSGDHVYILQADSTGQTRAHLRQVESGPVVGSEVLILTGLRAGEQVATSGSFKLRESVLVQVAPTPVASTGQR